MRVREDVLTRVPPERAWELLADPEIHGLWNPRITRTTPGGFGAIGKGYRYRVQYDLGRGGMEFDAEIVAFDPPRLFVARLEERVRSTPEARKRWCEERYEIRPAGAGAYVLHEVIVHHSGVPWPIRALVWFVMRFGEPVGQTYMQAFAELADGDAAAGVAAAGATASRR